jgi:hypothetical protein
MLLGAVSAGAREPTIEDAQRTDLLDLEPLPPVRGTASACAADLIDEQKLPAATNAVVVRLDSPRRSALIHQLNKTSFANRADEIGIDDRQHTASITRVRHVLQRLRHVSFIDATRYALDAG